MAYMPLPPAAINAQRFRTQLFYASKTFDSINVLLQT